MAQGFIHNLISGSGSATPTSADFVSLQNRVSAVSSNLSAETANRISADNALSVAISVLSAVVSNTASGVAALSLAVSVISTNLSAETVNRISADNALSTAISVLNAEVVANSAQMTSADNAISAAAASKNRIISIANQGSVLTINPEKIDLIGNAVSTYLSGSTVKIQISTAGGTASVTSAEYLSLVDRVSGNSTQMASADNALSNAISILSAVVSNQGSAIVANSAQMTSADNAISAAQAATSAAVTSVNNRVSNISADVTSIHNVTSNLVSEVSRISLDVSAISTRLSALSSQVTSVNDRVSVISADVTSIHNVTSNLVSEVSRISTNVSAMSTTVATNSADVTSLKNRVSANSALLSDALSAIVANSAQMTSADGALSTRITSVMTAVSTESASRAAADTSLDGRITSAVTLISGKNRLVSIANQGSTIQTDPQKIDFTGNAVSAYVSGSAIKVNISATAGGASVTSAEFVSLANIVSVNGDELHALSKDVSAISTDVAVLSNVVSAIPFVVMENADSVTAVKGMPVYAYGSWMENTSGWASAISAGGNAKFKLATNDGNALSDNIGYFRQRPIGLVWDSSVAVSAIGNIQTEGLLTATSAQWQQVMTSGSGLLPGAVYYVAKSNFGKIVANPTEGNGADTAFIYPVGIAISPVVMKIICGIVPDDTPAIVILSNAISAVSAIVAANSAQNTSTEAALSIRINGLANNVSQLSITVSAISTRLSALSSQVTSLNAAKNRILSVANDSSVINTNPERIDFIGNAVSAYLSGSTVKVDISVTAGGASVTSAEYLSLVDRVSSNSAQMTSADATKNRIISIANQGSTLLVNPPKIDFLGNAVSTYVSGSAVHVQISVTAGGASVTSAEYLSLVDRVSAISTDVASVKSVVGGGGGLWVVVQGEQGISATTLTNVSGLSLTLSAGGIYKIEGMLLNRMSVANVYKLGATWPAMVSGEGGGFWQGALSIGNNASVRMGVFNETGSGSVTFSIAAAANVMPIKLDALFHASATGSFQVQAAASVATSPLLIKAGSYIRAYKIGSI